MRKFIVLLAIAASSVFVLAASPSSALASNCQANMSGTYAAGTNWHFQSSLNNCTDVDQAQFRRTQPVIYPGSGWLDTNHQNGLFTAPAGYNVDEYLFGRLNISASSFGPGTWNIPPWCAVYHYPPGWIFPVQTFFAWRIHSTSQNTWGPWHQTITNPYNIGC